MHCLVYMYYILWPSSVLRANRANRVTQSREKHPTFANTKESFRRNFFNAAIVHNRDVVKRVGRGYSPSPGVTQRRSNVYVGWHHTCLMKNAWHDLTMVMDTYSDTGMKFPSSKNRYRN